MTFAFNSKQTYLAYRADWKQRFLDAINGVRAAKKGIREANRAYSKDGGIGGIWAAYANLREAHDTVKELQKELWSARAEAGRQMNLKKGRCQNLRVTTINTVSDASGPTP